MSSIDELTVELEEDGVLVVEELDKRVLTKGAWTTIMFKYREWDAKKNAYGAAKYSIRRYQKFQDVYRQRSKFNISSNDQARQIIEVLQGWLAEQPEQGSVPTNEGEAEE